MDTETRGAFDQWGVVEVMGHKKFAGHITEQVIAGSALVRAQGILAASTAPNAPGDRHA